LISLLIAIQSILISDSHF